MRRKNNGVQARIRKENPRAFVMPCGCHSLNFVVGDTAIYCTEAVSFFGIIQRRYILFSASVGRWKILKRQYTHIYCQTTLQRTLGMTDCLKPLRYQIAEIHDALASVNETSSALQ
jgi:hypothetical protein